VNQVPKNVRLPDRAFGGNGIAPYTIIGSATLAASQAVYRRVAQVIRHRGLS
jgi:hypothetical protein